jgi:hypothetical protein
MINELPDGRPRLVSVSWPCRGGFEPIDALADRADPGGEVRGDVGNARPRVVAEIAQELELGGDDAALSAESLPHGVVETGLAAD